jgi:hypothetical protein
MLNEINKDFYCVTGAFVKGEGCNYFGCGIPSQATKSCTEAKCGFYRRKRPTPEQYEEEYPDDGAVYCYTFDGAGYSWVTDDYKWAKKYKSDTEPIVCACAPFGKPDKNWRPE